MFGRAIRDKLPKCIFEILKFQKFSKTKRVIYPQSHPNQTCDYWLITPNQQTLFIETILTVSNYKSASEQLQNSGQLQNNTVNGAMSITLNRVIN